MRHDPIDGARWASSTDASDEQFIPWTEFINTQMPKPYASFHPQTGLDDDP
jgi:hypothetical protein